MWNTSIALPITNDSTQNENGFRSSYKGYMTGIPANKLDATRNDVMLASSDGYRADIVIEIDRAAYNGASEFIDESDREVYSVRRAFMKNRGNLIQLIGERRVKGKVL